MTTEGICTDFTCAVETLAAAQNIAVTEARAARQQPARLATSERMPEPLPYGTFITCERTSCLGAIIRDSVNSGGSIPGVAAPVSRDRIVRDTCPVLRQRRSQIITKTAPSLARLMFRGKPGNT